MVAIFCSINGLFILVKEATVDVFPINAVRLKGPLNALPIFMHLVVTHPCECYSNLNFILLLSVSQLKFRGEVFCALSLYHRFGVLVFTYRRFEGWLNPQVKRKKKPHTQNMIYEIVT